MLKLSKHFVENWRKRVGYVPCQAQILEFINQAIRLQKGRRMIGRYGDWINTLTIYWHTEHNLVITVDHYTDTVVSVYSKDMGRRRAIGDIFNQC